MKVLFIGSTRRTALALHYFTNLVRLGHIVLPYECDFFQSRHILDRAMIRVKRQPTRQRVDEVASDLITLCKRNQFDVVFALAENYLTFETIDEMKRVSNEPPLFLYHSHDNNFAPGIFKPENFAQTLKSYDLVFTTKSQNVKRYQELGQSQIFFLPSAFEPSIHHPIEDRYSRFAGRPFDVTFIGTYDKSRIPYLDSVGWSRVHVWGDYWKRFEKYKQLRDRIHPRAIYDFEFADVTSHSKCALGLLREEAEDLHTTRTFEIPACGALQIAPRNTEVLSYFEENQEIVCFGSLDELRDKTEYYLKNDWQRLQIARKGHERCLRDKHTYLDRVKEIFKRVDAMKKTIFAITEPCPAQPVNR